MTPHELTMYVETYNENRNREKADYVTQAYLTAYWYRTKKMPRLNKILKDLKPKEPIKAQTAEEMYEFAKRFTARQRERSDLNGRST